MSKLLKDDFLLINRNSVDYKMTGADLQAGGIIQSPTPPTIGDYPELTNGTIWVDTSQNPPVLNIWDGSGWVEIETGGGGGGGADKPPTGLPGNTIVLEETDVESATQLIEFNIDSTGWVDAGTAQAGQIIQVRWKEDLGGSYPPGTVLNEIASFTKTASGTVTTQEYSLTLAYPPLVELSATTISGEEQVGGDLVAVQGTVEGGIPPYSYATRWQRSANGLDSWADIGGASGTTYTLVTADGDQYVRAVTTATDSAFTPQELELPSVSSGQIVSTVAPVIGSVVLS